MIAVIFEAIPETGQMNEYLDLAAALKPALAGIPGFISIERFQSLANEEKVLSLSLWENEEAIHQWRNVELHRFAQARGRSHIFRDYQLKIAGVVRAYGMYDRAGAPTDSKVIHDQTLAK